MGGTTKCRSCGASIRWIRTTAGKLMPCDTNPVHYKISTDGTDKVVTKDGEVIRCTIVSYQGNADGYGYTPHWSTCNAPESFRNKGGHKNGI